MLDIRNSLQAFFADSGFSRVSSIFYLAMRTLHQRNMPSQHVYFRRNEQPSVSLALPPVGWQSTVEQPLQTTTVSACEKTVVMVKQPGHFTSMKNDRGAGTRFCEPSTLEMTGNHPQKLWGGYTLSLCCRF